MSMYDPRKKPCNCTCSGDAGKALGGVLQFGMYTYPSSLSEKGLWKIPDCIL